MNIGVATRLFASVMHEAKLKEVADIIVHSDPNAESFYQKLGFKTIDRVASGSIAGRTLPLMKMSLY